jgi:hypothetical protein
MLLSALHDMYVHDGFSTVPKHAAIQFITRRHWFDVHEEDSRPYPSQSEARGEPRWHNLIAWARKDSVLRDIVSDHARDEWGLTRHGRSTFEEDWSRCRSGLQPVQPCFLWSAEFKKFMYPEYVAGNDAKRPRHFYRDIAPVPERYVETARAIISNGTWLRFAHDYRELVGEDYGAWVPTDGSERDVERLARMVGEYLGAKLRDIR